MYRTVVLRWYARHGRDLPWRRTRDPYAILASEFMLQQTPVARVVPVYEAFLARFPSLQALAAASLGDVLRVWGGLGYPRRARDLHRIARECGAGLPRDLEALDALPGIGPYTAGAVTCFAHGDAAAFADTNVARVLGRVVLGRDASPAEAVALDDRLMSRRAPARWHHALMDIGALFCRAVSPRCEACPLAKVCVARARGIAPARPRRRATSFATSDRRVRGRIMAALRAAPAGLTLAVLRRETDDGRVPRLVDALEADGLVERTRARVRLPR